ncbi:MULTISPECIES: ArsR/SmtB family transcription factor [Protofrankia]|uniref:Regulatory protein ArsR n=1 Tax=Candidatus Protofrankia datiscae TaxID=2716812 RepID=F8B3S5_9ACTN|nr:MULTISPECIES: helix-turn-helix transcriptional regulator [Protofrankia]AEH09020.1 regulatory protein ArsR [Candidatus Protofrankia datiscae]
MHASDYDLAAVAKVIGEPARATMLLRLMDGQAHAASALAAAAGVSQSTASAHLSHLADAGLITVRAEGCRRLHVLASADVAAAVEALGCIAPLLPVESLTQARTGSKLQFARACYSHLGGSLAVGVTRHLLDDGVISMDADRHSIELLTLDHQLLRALDITTLSAGSGPVARGCLDWTEQQPHLAGRLGTAILAALLSKGWLLRRRHDRALDLTDEGERGLRRCLTELAVPVRVG